MSWNDGQRNHVEVFDVSGQGVGTVNGSAFEITQLGKKPTRNLMFIVDRSVVGGGGGAHSGLIQDSFDGVNWDTLGTIPSTTSTGATHVNPTRCPARFVRVQSTVGAGGNTYTVHVGVVGDIGVAT